MLAAGAEGQTLKQLLEFLGHETIDQLLYESPSTKLCKQILSNNGEGSLDVSVANGVWVADKLSPFQSCYQEILKTVYKTEARFVDFENKPDESAKEINSWVNKKTRGLFSNIVDSSELRQNVTMLMVNALYFKGLWLDPFDESRTKKKDFHLFNGETVSVPFMTSRKEFATFGSFRDLQILKIPYVTEIEGSMNNFSMYIFLPDRKVGLQDMLQVFHSDQALFHTRFDLHYRLLNKIRIPKFKISYTFEAHDVMQQMGLRLPFDPMNKELTRIIDSKSPAEDMLYVSKILQKSFIEIDEKGTEAAALSAIDICLDEDGPPPPPPASFVADHPFMFMIREDTSLAVLFVGVVLNPNASP